jgi:hypothetical protein
MASFGILVRCWQALALVFIVGAGQAHAADLRSIEFEGLRVGASIDQVDARYPLDVRTIFSEPEFPSLGVYLYRCDHRDGAVTLRADFDRQRRLYSWTYSRTARRVADLRPMLDAFLERQGPPDRVSESRGRPVYVYALPWRNGNPGAEVRLRLGIEDARIETADGPADGARLVVDFIDYGADEANIAAAYDGAVAAERRRVGGEEARESP